MAPESNKVWTDLTLLIAVTEAMDAFCHVFRLSRKHSSSYEFEQVAARIRKGEFALEERRRSMPVTPEEVAELQLRNRPIPKISDEFRYDILEACQLPRAWDRLADALQRDFCSVVRAKVETFLSSRPQAGKPDPNAIVREVLRLLFWKIALLSKVLVKVIEQNDSFFDWLDGDANRAVERFAQPSEIFGRFGSLREVGDAWQMVRMQLGLPRDERAYDRDDIHAKRLALAVIKVQMDGSEQETVPFDDVRKLVPWPPEIQDFMRVLMDPEQTRDLHVVLRYHAEEALRLRRVDFPNVVFPDVDEVVAKLRLGYVGEKKTKQRPTAGEIALQLGISEAEVGERLKAATDWLKQNVARENPA